MKIRRVNVVNEVVKHLESNILSGTWQPGQKIDTELSLSKQLDVSRASVHAAIQQLIAIGVLESYQGKGTFVKSTSVMELENRLNTLTNGGSLRKMMEFRIILEGEICSGIASNISEDTLNEMYSYVEKMNLNKNNPQITKDCDMQFHRTLFLATRNEFIIQSLNVICDELERSHITHHNPDSIDLTIMYHKNICDCLRAGDGEGARRNMIFHLATTPCEPPFDLASVETIESSLFTASQSRNWA